MERPSFKKRFLYWFDTKMSKGSLGLINVLVIITLFIIVLISLISVAVSKIGVFEAIWNTLVTVINAWMPSIGDFEFEEVFDERVYLIIMAVAAIFGLLITSVLIGIIASAIEEKIQNLKRGNSAVIENDHIVVLGFYPREYTLIRQLVLAAADNPVTIVVADDMPRDEMEDSIHDNVDIPKNVKLICRTVNLFDPSTLEKLSLSTCRNIIISPTDDFRTTKALLAVSTLIHDTDNKKVRVGAIISKNEYIFPPTIAKKHNVTTLQTNDTIAKIIAHSCTQPGLSETFKEVFNFEGSELYNIDIPNIEDYTFGQLMVSLDQAVPVGINRGRHIEMNPDWHSLINKDDKILVFAEDKNAASLKPDTVDSKVIQNIRKKNIDDSAGTVVIIGANKSLTTVLNELPENVTDVIVVNLKYYTKETIRDIGKYREINTSFETIDISKSVELIKLVRKAEHIILLSDHDEDEEKADMEIIFLLLNLRDIRARHKLKFNITAEMRREANQSLVVTDDHTDFVVASNMSSLFLAQLAESPELADVFSEILSNEGNELYLKKAGDLSCSGERTVSELRTITMLQNYIFLGYMKSETMTSVFNPPLKEVITLTENDSVIVLGEN